MNGQFPVPDEVLARWMKSALAVAVEGVAKGEAPFGASVVQMQVDPESESSQADWCRAKVIASEHNRVRSLNDPSAHAEVRAIRAACGVVGGLRLDGCWLITTGEPCPMCLSTAALAGIRNVVYGGPREVIDEAGYQTLGLDSCRLASLLQPIVDVCGPVLPYDCSALLLNHSQDG